MNLKTVVSKLDSSLRYLQVSSLARRIRREGLTYLSPVKLYQIEQELKRIKSAKVQGDFAEFGIALGGSAILLAKNMGTPRRFHGFDVFAMIPPPDREKDGDKSVERYEKIRDGKSTGINGEEYYGYRKDLYETVVDSFARFEKPVKAGSDVSLYRGLFEDTWPDAGKGISKLALVHIDCDWYEPVKYCLEASDAKLSVGGAVVIDDYFAYPGAKSATDEFLAAHKNYSVARRHKHLIIHKTA
jgi:O-methyltransferase